MSNPSSALEHPSPSSSVRSFGAVNDSNHVPSTASKAKPKAITGPALAQREGPDTISQPIVENCDHQNGHPHNLGSNGVLNAGEGSDPNTPRLPPTELGNIDLENIPHEAVVTLDSPDLPYKSLASSQIEYRRYPYSFSGAAATTFPSSFSERSTQTLSKPTGSDRRGPPTPFSHEIAHNHPPANQTVPLPYVPYTKSYGIASIVPMSGTRSQDGTQTSIGPGSDHSMAMGAREEAFSGEKRNRSSSRSSQSRVEKKIEATMADVEPSSHARSRKSSHVLGLFKENKSSYDIKKGQERQRTTSDNSIDAVPSEITTRSEQASRSGHEGRPLLAKTRDRDDALGTPEEPLPVRHEPGKSPNQPFRQSQLHQQLLRASSIANTSANGLRKSRSEADLTLEDWRPAIVKRQEKLDYTPEPKLPPRLLEEIRDFHNLTTPFHDKFRLTQLKSTGTKSASEDKETIDRHWEDQLPEQKDPDKVDLSKLAGEPENEEEESEHISSALYYPHEAPSPDALEDISIDDARRRKDSHLKSEQKLPDPALPVISEDEQAGDVDIALQVHQKNRYLHGDFQKVRSSSAEPEPDRHSETGFSSTSESEYESLDEVKASNSLDSSSLTDDAEATPRASPKSRQSYLLSRSRKSHRSPKAPLGAVELKPYNHQVGGHTTVFRFSKRAVCKQLTNRENEFYEVIERQHPDFLKFLPRYVHHDAFNVDAGPKTARNRGCAAPFARSN